MAVDLPSGPIPKVFSWYFSSCLHLTVTFPIPMSLTVSSQPLIQPHKSPAQAQVYFPFLCPYPSSFPFIPESLSVLQLDWIWKDGSPFNSSSSFPSSSPSLSLSDESTGTGDRTGMDSCLGQMNQKEHLNNIMVHPKKPPYVTLYSPFTPVIQHN